MPPFLEHPAPRAGGPCRHRPDRRPAARLGLLAGLAVLAGALGLGTAARAQPPAADPPAALDQAIALLTEARLHLQAVRDYECRLIKQERVHGKLLPPAALTLRVRHDPFSVYLRCDGPGPDRGLQACYVAGRDAGMMRVHPAGWLGIVGFVSVDPHDPRAFETNRHCITEAGLGHLLESTARYWDMERRLNRTIVRIADDELHGRPCVRIETIHPDRNAGPFYGYRCVLWLDRFTHLPAGAETYDWPPPGGPGDGELLERYRYLGLRCNIGLRDADFPR